MRLEKITRMPIRSGCAMQSVERDNKAFRKISLSGASLRKLIFALTLPALFVTLLGSASPSFASGSSAFLKPQVQVSAPPGFSGLCGRYGWVCKASGKTTLSQSEKRGLAWQINRAVNRQVREIEDIKQYGVEEHWALPTQRGGDCEDLVLLKKKLLVERGFPSQSLLIATVLDKRLNSHAVLVFRSAQGDLVLDNLTNEMKPWNDTGYTFLKLQDPSALSRWNAVLAGGLIDDSPTASR